ncbi:ADL188Cp [Eremothecium gossypii ATCC 10895]|uniref:Eukaryotic translation initiation factor 4E n=1 Tax=Eremothecium gossypii (strain ATCC 10895 / CBS 109.51 / FGSC 9923 / NRRL Y-1056) TaxID=284811 RepID=IF4E_EREGS|nr:ADL188Cp [Eremothecium gossypii ATCC 10895]Q75AV8.2 RecName: Full=Eukaryotic translation initiation factor 4E; Short=eIF-4E; Short=eIF4E; AltName: Full=eIF-4F 25 kDa subunit; AltName: Full=mRNA cap-binding protein [Eremothecium gossypii ATCC 10895]AAS51732.2 ADL188Cp [Eremothecium gossypii ATCC 10895]AEY96029.1 FADL188Cp [Eremothecium gossypii FDAG1]
MSVEEVTQKAQALSVGDNEERKTVLTDSKDFDLKHPLNSKWTLWYTKPPVGDNESWSDLLRPVTSFTTVEEFWAIQNAIPKPRELPLKSDYHLFRNDIRPEWEDEANSRGGKWSFQFKVRNPPIDDLWLRALLAVIGESIDEDESEINGVVINVRRSGFKIGLWTKSVRQAPLSKVGAKFKAVLQLDDSDTLEFFAHSSANDKNAKPALVL